MRFAFAGDRKISVNILKYLISQGYQPLALLVANGKNTSHKTELVAAAELPKSHVITGNDFTSEENINLLKSLQLDYIIGIHFPYIIPAEVLDIPKIGFLNLHPAYLPFNKGWHTPSWAILDETLYGATLHFMSEALDNGDIIHQEKIEIKPGDTANSLYKRVLQLEEKVFKDALPQLVTLKPGRLKQTEEGSSHRKNDLKKIQQLSLDDSTTVANLINKLRALTTNNKNEACYFEKNGKKYSVQILIEEKE